MALDIISLGIGVALALGVKLVFSKIKPEVQSNCTFNNPECPLDIDRICAMIESGALSLSKAEKGDTLIIKDNNFYLRVLDFGWHWNSTHEYGEYTPTVGMHAALYNYGDGFNFISISTTQASKLKEAFNSKARGKLSSTLDKIES